MYRHAKSAERKWLQQNNCSSAKFKSTLSLSQQNWSIKDSQMVSLMEHNVVMVFCAHTTLFPEIFTCLLIFAQRSSKLFWYLPKADLCVSADICPQIFERLLIFAHVTSQNYCYFTTYFRMCAAICPLIFAYLLILAHKSSRIYWYLPTVDLCTSAGICPWIFARQLILAHRYSHQY